MGGALRTLLFERLAVLLHPALEAGLVEDVVAADGDGDVRLETEALAAHWALVVEGDDALLLRSGRAVQRLQRLQRGEVLVVSVLLDVLRDAGLEVLEVGVNGGRAQVVDVVH